MAAINKMAEAGTFFWDYGNAFLLESSRAGRYRVQIESKVQSTNYRTLSGEMRIDTSTIILS